MRASISCSHKLILEEYQSKLCNLGFYTKSFNLLMNMGFIGSLLILIVCGLIFFSQVCV